MPKKLCNFINFETSYQISGGGVCILLRAKGFTWITLVVRRFDREFVITFQRHGSVRGKNGA